MSVCYIIGAGENFGLDFALKKDDFLIAVDGGLNYLDKNIKIDLFVGDLDSCKNLDNFFIKEKKILKCEKNETDTFVAIDEGIKKGYKKFHIYCCTGFRTDHTFANIQILSYLAKKKIKGFVIDKNFIITAINNSSVNFDKKCKGYISIFSYSNKSTGVFIEGLKYEVQNFKINNFFPIGISNEFIGIKSKISVKNGILLIFFPRECLTGILF